MTDASRRPTAICPECDPGKGPVIEIKPGRKPTPKRVENPNSDCEHCEGFGEVEGRLNGDCDIVTCKWCKGTGRRTAAA